MKKLRTILQSRCLFKFLAVIFLIYGCCIINFYHFQSKSSNNATSVTGIITKYSFDGNKLTIYVKADEVVIVNYYFDSKKERDYYIGIIKLGNKIRVDGEFKMLSDNTVPNTFNYKKYLYYNRIYYIIDANNIKFVSNNTSILYFLKNIIIDRIDSIDSTGYLKTFILGDKFDMDEEKISNYQKNGISHLFSISGMHISLIAGVILFILGKFSYNIRFNYLIVIIFLLFYMLITSISPSILRATVMFILFGINRCYNLKIKSIDIMLLVLIVVIIIDPFYLCNIGFQFSYLISSTLVLLSNKIKIVKGKFKNSLYISFICFFVSFPISIYNFYQVNFLSILLNIIFIPMVSIFIYPLALLVFIFPFLYNIFLIFVNILEFFNDIFSNINLFSVVFSKPSIVIIGVYYILIYLMLYDKRFFSFLIFVLTLHKCYVYYNDNFKVTIIDVGQGDSILINLSNNRGNILIDTGGVVSYNKEEWMIRKKPYSIVESRTILYFKSLGIDRLDYLILTHGDYDHMGEAINLVNNFKVDKVIFNCGEYNYLEKELIKVLENKNIKYYSCIKELNIDDNKLYFLNNELHDNENDNSNVIYFNYNNHKFLFMGDAGIEKEKDILDKYNIKDIDFLKLGHHGSNTSSSKEFIENINPKYSLISVGKNNRYGHPKESVLDILNNSKIYRTDLDGSIEIELNKNGYKIRTCSP